MCVLIHDLISLKKKSPKISINPEKEQLLIVLKNNLIYLNTPKHPQSTISQHPQSTISQHFVININNLAKSV